MAKKNAPLPFVKRDAGNAVSEFDDTDAVEESNQHQQGAKPAQGCAPEYSGGEEVAAVFAAVFGFESGNDEPDAVVKVSGIAFPELLKGIAAAPDPANVNGCGKSQHGEDPVAAEAVKHLKEGAGSLAVPEFFHCAADGRKIDPVSHAQGAENSDK